jgi:hypothetical protein
MRRYSIAWIPMAYRKRFTSDFAEKVLE